MATKFHDAETQELRPHTAARYVLELHLEDGETLRTDAGSDADSARAQLAAIHAAAGENFVYAGRDVVVRASEIRYARIRGEDDGDDGGDGLVDTIKSKVGGGNRMTMYDTETRGSRVRARNWDDDGSNEPIFGYGNRPFAETKPFFLTSEFLTLLGSIAGVGIAMAVLDDFDANRGWLLIAILAAAYMVSRGIAKSGSRDPNPRGDYR